MKIRNFVTILVLGLTLNSSFAFADSRAGLADTMDSMAAQFKLLGLAFIKGKATPQADLVAAATKLSDLVKIAIKQAPSQFLDRNGNVKPDQNSKDQVAKFEETMGKMVVATENLEAALTANEMNAAKDIFNTQIVNIRKDGHDNFRQ